MAEVINMPRLSDTMEEGTVTKWFKKIGDQVKEGDILAEIETDKATMEFESFQEGELLHIGLSEGDSAPVDSLLAIIGKKGEDISGIINPDSKDKIEQNELDSQKDIVEELDNNDKSENNDDWGKYAIDIENISKYESNCKMNMMDELEGILKTVDDAIDDLEVVAEEYDLKEHEWESVDDTSDYLFEHKVKGDN